MRLGTCQRAARAGTRVGAVHQPGHVGFAGHVGGFVAGGAVDRQRHRHTQRQRLGDARDARAQPRVALRAVRDAGAGGGAQPQFVVVQVHHVREPDVGADPLVAFDELHRRAAVHLARPAHVVVGLRQVAVQPDAQPPRLARQRLQLVLAAAPVRRGDGADDAAHRHRAGVVETPHVVLDTGQEGVQRLGRALRRRLRVRHRARLGLAAAAQHEAQAELLGFLEHHGRGVEGHARVVVVLVVGHRAAARQRQLHQPHARGDAQRLLAVEEAPVRHRHRSEPRHQRLVDARGHALEQALEQVVVGVDPARVDDAAGGVEHTLAGLGGQRADGGDDAAAHADVGAARGAHGVAAAGPQVGGALQQQGVSHGGFRFRASCPAPSATAPTSRRTAARR